MDPKKKELIMARIRAGRANKGSTKKTTTTKEEQPQQNPITKAATNTANLAEDIAGSNKVGFAFIQAVAGEEVDNTEGYEQKKHRIKQPKRKNRKWRPKVKGTRIEIIDGQEVEVTVLEDEKEYYTGKSIPTGNPPHGGRGTTDQTMKTLKYAIKRKEAAEEQESKTGRCRKGGDQEDWTEAVQNLADQLGINPEDAE